jgi:carbonic anhydrase/acetyltransferase-like protein (isoleucine patch superfamily)
MGNVILKKNASVWFGCILRGDNDRITVGENSNIQDASVLHVDPGFPLSIGDNVTVGHKVMLHGCTIGNNTLIGMNAVVLNGAKIGNHCIVGANALVTENTEVPDGTMVLGSPAKTFKPLPDKVKESLAKGAEHYVENAKKFMDELNALID